ncbi:MAG: DUF1573 domain-containing protein [Ferruginibacter sp.]|nr:DUF1573 domain-containing protein [Cytophagales bacterium]
MKKTRVFPLLALFASLLVATAGFAQGDLKFKTDLHDFGTIEEGVQATYKFEFTNVGTEPVIVSNVQASCGCTTPSWTKEPVLPGKKGEITASYNSNGRPNAFNKTITVTSNAKTPSVVLTLKGVVNPKGAQVTPVVPVKSAPAPSPEELKKSPVGVLNKTQHNFGKLEKGQSVTHKFTLMNTGLADLKIEQIQSACNCVSYQLAKPTVKAGETAQLELRYAPRKANPGLGNEVVTLYTNDLNKPTLQVTLQANVVESLASQSALKEQKPAVPFK